MPHILKGRLNGVQRNRLKGLLDMLYSPHEISNEVGFHVDQVYNVYIPLGCPHERDAAKHIRINGKRFAEWYGEVYPKIVLAEDETFCKTCKQGVKIHQPKQRKKGLLLYVVSICPVCGRRLTKILSYGSSK